MNRAFRIFSRPSLAAPALAFTLCGCGAVELVASGISDGAKFIINAVDGQSGSPPPQAPANTQPPPPVAVAPAGDMPPVTAVPVIPVTKGQPIP